jgi:hypothetical protein
MVIVIISSPSGSFSITTLQDGADPASFSGRGARTLTVKFTKIRDAPTRRICNRIENTRIRFLIDPVADGTKSHIPKPSFDTLPYSSGSFIQTIGGEWLWHMWCGVPNSNSGIATSTRRCKRWHEASLTRYGQSRRDGRNRYGLRHVKCHESVVGQRCLPAKVVQQHVVRQWCRRCARFSR